MALHGGGHLEFKKMHKGDFWGRFGIRLGRCPCIIPEKISFLQFYSRFNPNALALYAAAVVNIGLILHFVLRKPHSVLKIHHCGSRKLHSVPRTVYLYYSSGVCS